MKQKPKIETGGQMPLPAPLTLDEQCEVFGLLEDAMHEIRVSNESIARAQDRIRRVIQKLDSKGFQRGVLGIILERSRKVRPLAPNP